MGWKKVALVGCTAPAFAGGCHLYQMAAHNIVNEHHVAFTECAVDRELRRDAKASWQEVRNQFPRRMFTSEFRDGFLDGYADYLARGGSAQPPAVPPPKYTRDKKYFTPEGHCLIRDYFLGFKYGVDVAVASGQRKFLTVPVLLPEKADGPPTFNVQQGVEVHPGVIPPGAVLPGVPEGLPLPPPESKALPLDKPRALPAPPGGETTPPKTPDLTKPPELKKPAELTKPADPPPKTIDPPAKPAEPKAKDVGLRPGVPWVSPATRPDPGAKTAAEPTPPPKKTEVPPPKPTVLTDIGSKFGPPTVGGGAPPDAENRLPPPNPPLPVIGVPLVPKAEPKKGEVSPFRPPPPARPKVTVPPGGLQPASFTAPLPVPPDEVPTLPGHLPTPSVFDDIPVLPATLTTPDPLPATLATPPAMPASSK